MRLTRLLTCVLLGAVLAVSADDTEVEEIEDMTLEEAGTKADGIRVEEVKPPADVFTAEERATVTATSETHEFQAEVTRLMDILINSLYSNREIFLRELISNAADACDKLRYQALTSPELLREGEELGIQLSFNKGAQTITITDMGVGMTKADLITNLGVVAKSGTSDFLDKASNGDSLNLIGQFGVGFYSVYLVANKVTVISKHSSDDQHIWESTANSQFTITKDPRGNTLGRGTSIVLHLKDDAQEYMDEATITRLVGRYSQFIDFPISLKSSKTITRTVELTEEEIASSKAETKDGEEDADTEDDEEEEEVATTKEVSEVVDDWKVLNLAKPIWTRNPKDISEEDYTEFYKTLTKDSAAPLDKIHFVAEGEISFKAILYIPETAEADLYDKYQEKSNGLKLYVRRVLISDEFDNFLPRYMNFVKGLVDSDDLPINVSRETLTQTRILKVMAKKITRKVLEMLRKMEERSHTDEEDEEEEGSDKKEDKALVEGAGDFDAFYAQYSKSIKLGVIEDKKNRNKLVKLLRYQSSKSNGKLISFEDYVDRAKENQNNIFYMTCSSIAACEATPVLEKFVKRGFEVLYMDEPVDEYTAPAIQEVDGMEPLNIMRENAKIPESPGFQALAASEDMKGLKEWFETTFDGQISKATVSNKLVTSPAGCSVSQYGYTGNMQRITKAQAMQSGEAAFDVGMMGKTTFEFNPYHPIVKEINTRRNADADDTQAKTMALLLLDSAKIASGYDITEADAFAKRIHNLVSLSLNIDPTAPVAKEHEEVEEQEPSEEEDDEEEEAEELNE